MKTKKIRFILAGASALLFANAAFGASGTWTNTAGGSWGLDTNWSGGIIAANEPPVNNFTAFFNTVDISGNTTVSLNGDRSIRSMSFNDTPVSDSATWILATGNSPAGGALTLIGGASRDITVANTTVRIDARLSGTSGFTKLGGGTVILNNATNDISGAVVITSGNLRLNAAGLTNATSVAINGSSILAIDSTAANLIGGTISFNGANGRLQYFANPGQDLSANFSTANGQLYNIVTQANRVVTYATDLSSVGGTMLKTGPGTLILEADNSYTGATSVNSGTLQLDGSTSASSAVSVGTNGILAGRGTVNGTLGVTGILAPGDAGVVDIQNLAAGTTTWNSGSIWNFDLSSINATSDKLNITGDFTKGSAGTYQFDFKGSAPSMDTTYTLVEWSGTTDFVLGDFSFTNLGGGPYAVSSFAFDGTSLTFTAVPEPPAAGFAGWIDGFDLLPADQDPTDDPDNDSIDNLLEFVLNGNPSVSDPSILPDLLVTTDDFEFTFQRRDDSVSPETTQTFEWGTTLVTWPGSAVIPAASGAVGAATITVSPGVPDDGITDTVKISIPKTEAGGAGKLFGRLQVINP